MRHISQYRNGCFKAEGMVYRIHCRPFAAWVGPFAILLPVYFVEVLTYGILHPKKSYKNILIGILLLLALWAVGLLLSGL